MAQNPIYFNRAEGIDPYSPCISNAFDLFTLPAIEIANDDLYIAEYSPTEPIVDTTTEIFFNVGMSTDFTCLQDTNMYIELQLTKEDGSPLAAFTATGM